MTAKFLVPGPLGSPSGSRGRLPSPLGIGPSIIFFGDPVPAKVVKKRTGTLVLYIAPPRPKTQKSKDGTEYDWSFDTEDGRREYQTLLGKHLKEKRIVSGEPDYDVLSGTADFAKLASDEHAKLVLIVHAFRDYPAIGTDLGNSAAGVKADSIMADEFAEVIGTFGYENITILACDAVSNKFAPSLAKLLPKGATVTAHEGGAFEIGRHFEIDKKAGRQKLTHLTSNLQLKTFKTEGKNP
jgi:hypothetical protein